MKSSESIAKLADALVKANLLITNPTKDRTVSGGSYSYSYVELGSILADLRPLLQAHGLAVVQEARSADSSVGVATRIIHASGEWLEFDPLWLPMGSSAQNAGSGITYARRYALCAALGIAADEDDDGAKAKTRASADGSSEASARPGDGAWTATSPATVASEGAAPAAAVSASSSDAASTARTGIVQTSSAESSPAPLAGSKTDETTRSNGSPTTPVAGDSSSEGGSGASAEAGEAGPPSVEPSQEIHVHGDWVDTKPEGGKLRPSFLRCTVLKDGKSCDYIAKRSEVAA